MVSGWSLARIFVFFGIYWKLRRSILHAERVIFLRPVAPERAAPGRGFRVEAGCLGANRTRRRAMTAQDRMPLEQEEANITERKKMVSKHQNILQEVNYAKF
jgi:hypothetical protein